MAARDRATVWPSALRRPVRVAAGAWPGPVGCLCQLRARWQPGRTHSSTKAERFCPIARPVPPVGGCGAQRRRKLSTCARSVGVSAAPGRGVAAVACERDPVALHQPRACVVAAGTQSDSLGSGHEGARTVMRGIDHLGCARYEWRELSRLFAGCRAVSTLLPQYPR